MLAFKINKVFIQNVLLLKKRAKFRGTMPCERFETNKGCRSNYFEEKIFRK